MLFSSEKNRQIALKIWRSKFCFHSKAVTRKGRHCRFQIWRELSLLPQQPFIEPLLDTFSFNFLRFYCGNVVVQQIFTIYSEIKNKNRRRKGKLDLRILNEFNIHKHLTAQISIVVDASFRNFPATKRALFDSNRQINFLEGTEAFNYLPQLLNTRG